jgi:hypothetical protein
MVKRKKDPVYDPDARVYLTGISGEKMSYSNPGSRYREVSVSIRDLDTAQSGHSYVDSRMENYQSVGWPNIITILQLGHVLTGRGVLRKNYQTDEIYFDCDSITHLELVTTDSTEPTEITFGNGLVTMIK